MAQQHSPLSLMKKPGIYKPTFKFGFRAPGNPENGFTEVLPLKKYWPVIAVMVVLTGIFSFPLVMMDFGFGETEDLFDLTSTLFSLFWAFGWSMGVLMLLGILLVLLFAREVLIVEPDNIRLRMEIFNLGVESSNPLPYISHLRYIDDGTLSGSRWRGKHLTFDYLQVPVSFGSALDSDRARELTSKITATLSHPVPRKLSEEIQALMAKNQPLPEHTVNLAKPEPYRAVTPPGEVGHSRLSLWLLLAANLVPLGGVIMLDWNVGDIMLLFWFESAIIGFFNILKMFCISGPVAIFFSIFFIGHFGAFMSVHLLFIFGLFFEEQNSSTKLAEVASIFQDLWIAILALLISHGFSFFNNFLGNREYRTLSIKDQMHKPYPRIMLMHVTLIFGGFLILALDSRFLALTLLIVLKIIVDMSAHIKEHRSAAKEK